MSFHIKIVYRMVSILTGLIELSEHSKIPHKKISAKIGPCSAELRWQIDITRTSVHFQYTKSVKDETLWGAGFPHVTHIHPHVLHILVHILLHIQRHDRFVMINHARHPEAKLFVDVDGTFIFRSNREI